MQTTEILEQIAGWEGRRSSRPFTTRQICTTKEAIKIHQAIINNGYVVITQPCYSEGVEGYQFTVKKV
jgi:hypothetical protein